MAVDKSPSDPIRGRDVEGDVHDVVSSDEGRLSIEDDVVLDMLRMILVELRIMNAQFALITGEEISNEEVPHADS